MRKLLSVALAAMVVVAMAPARAQDTKERGALAWKLAKGDKLRYAYVYEQDGTTDTPMGALKQKHKLTLHLSQEVTDVANDTATVSAKIDRVIGFADLGPMFGGPTSWDSDKDGKAAPKEKAKKDGEKDGKKDDDDDDDEAGDDDAKPLAVLAVAVGKSFTFKLGKDGAVSDVSGVDEIATALGEKVAGGALGGGNGPGGFDPKKLRKAAAGGTMAIILTKDVLQRTLNLHCQALPKDGAKADSWTIETQQSVGGLGDLGFTRTIKSEGDGEAAGEKGVRLVQSSGELKFTPSKAPQGGGGGGLQGLLARAKTKVKSATFSGKTVFSTDKGRVLWNEVTEKVTADMKVAMPGGLGGGPRRGKKADDDDDGEKKDEGKKEDGVKKDEGKKEDGAKKDEGKKEDGVKKDEGKKEKPKAKDDDDDDEDDGMTKLGRKLTLKTTYELLTGDGKTSEKKDDGKKDDKKDNF